MYPAKRNVTKPQRDDEFESEETSVCPFCGGLEFDEFVEPQPQITSVKSVNIEDVDALLKDGYVVLEVYAKTANLVKKVEKPCLRERNECNDKDAAVLREELAGFLKEQEK
jgi:hypothetical protein